MKAQKLIRDFIPDIIRMEGKIPKVRTLTLNHFQRALRHKLAEEADEVIDAVTDDDLLQEIADCMEVLHALIKAYGFNSDAIEIIRLKKRSERGGFEKRLFLERVESAQS